MQPLAHAIALAAEAHKDQTDKAGAPYILHPLRLMFTLDTEDEQIAAVLHDIVEDTDKSLEDLRAAGFSETVLAAIDALTHRQDESYDEYVARAFADPVARKVKLADLEDNMNLRRLSELTDKDIVRLQKYHKLWRQWKDAEAPI